MIGHEVQPRRIPSLGIFLLGSQIRSESLVGKVPLIRARAPLKAAVLLRQGWGKTSTNRL